MSVLERRYRRYLRVLPAWYRDRWEQEMVTALLDKQPDRARPRLGEVVSVLSLGLRLRIGGVRPKRRPAAWDRVPYRLALLGIFCFAAFWVVVAAITAFRQSYGGGPEFPAGAVQLWLWRSRWALPFVELLWLGAFVALLFDRLRTARWLSVIAFAYPIIVDVLVAVFGPPLLMSSPWTILTAAGWVWRSFPVVALLFLRRTLPIRRRRWLLAFVAVVVVGVPALLALSEFLAPDPFGMLCSVVIAGTVVLLIAGLRRPGAAPWLLTVSILGAGAAGLRLLDLYGPDSDYSERYLLVGTTQAAIAILVALTALVLGTTTTARPPSLAERA